MNRCNVIWNNCRSYLVTVVILSRFAAVLLSFRASAHCTLCGAFVGLHSRQRKNWTHRTFWF